MLHTKSTYCKVGNTDEWTDGHIKVTEKLRSLTIKIFLDSMQNSEWSHTLAQYHIIQSSKYKTKYN